MHHDQPFDALPDEEYLEVVPTTDKKRPAARSNAGRAHSIGAVWEFRDEGDLGYQGQEDQLQPKRRKSAPAKRPKLAKVPTQPLPQITESNQDDIYAVRTDDQEIQTSQLTPPPDSTKRPKSKSAPKSKKPQLPPFKSLTVTKPAANIEKELANDPVSSYSAVNSQLGWTTTQEYVKLPRTTLDKLAAFRYKDPTQGQATSAMSRYASTHSIGRTQRQELATTDRVAAPPSSDYGPFSSSDSLFKDSHWDAETVKQACSEVVPTGSQADELQVNQTEDNTVDSQLPETEDLVTNTFLVEKPAALHTNSIDRVPGANPQPVGHATSSQNDTHYDAPTSSEVMMMDGLLNNMQTSQVNPQLTEGRLPDHATLSEETSMVKHSADQNTLSPAPVFEVEGTGVNLGNGYQEVIQCSETNLNPQAGQESCSQHSDIQVAPSDDEVGIINYDASEDFELNEFDEGLDDEDLLGLTPDATEPRIIVHNPRTNLEVDKIYQDKTKLPATARHPSDTIQRLSPDYKTSQADPIIPQPQSTPLQISEPDDEFPMDAADEEWMLEAAGVVETFEAPESLQRALDSDSGEVFDRSLQFSPPKPQKQSASPSKMANDSCTDKTSNAPSPERVPLLMSEEEDWSFIRGDDTVTDVSPDVEEDYRSSIVPAPSPARKISDYFKSQETQQTMGSTQRFLDDSHEYLPLYPFVRPNFPALTPDRCPIVGVSTHSFLRVCFRVGEMFKEGGKCSALGQDAVIELFAKVIFSSREAGTIRQIFQFGDIFFDKPPIANGILMNYKITGLAESESKIFVGKNQGMMARCLGRLKRDKQTASGWLLHIITIRETDWEEIRWTKRIVSAGLVESEIPRL